MRVDQQSDLERAIDQFESLSNLRHALVHSGGVVNSRNAKNLGNVTSGSTWRVHLGPAELQVAASVCMDLVRTSHDEIGKQVFWNWITTGHLKGNWSHDRARIGRFASVFFSVRDAVDDPPGPRSQKDLHDLAKSILGDVSSSQLRAPGERRAVRP